MRPRLIIAALILVGCAQPAAPVRLTGVYLQFERGFMVYIDGQDCLWAYTDGIIIPAEISRREMGMYRYCVEFTDLPDAPAAAPEGAFGRAWARYPEMSAFLGAPVGEVTRYETTIPPGERVIMGGVFYSGEVTLPNGDQLYCGRRAATAGDCQLR